jgi:electron transfer flavoprotein beta subunit
LKIVVCVKQVPDSAAQLSVRAGNPDWGDAPLVMNPWDEFAVEAALRQVEAHSGDVVALSIGTEESKETLKHALAMGCAQAFLVSDPALAQADSFVTAQALAAAIKKINTEDEPVLLAFFGRQAIDTDTGITSIQTARLLGWPALSLVSAIKAFDLQSGALQVERNMEEGRQVVNSRIPAVISVVKDIAEPRYPSFMGIRKASRADIPIWSVADLGIGELHALVSWPEVSLPPQYEVKTEMITGANAQVIAEKLVERILEEKAL